MRFIGSLLFSLFMIITTIMIGVVLLATFFLPFKMRSFFTTIYAKSNIIALRVFCGIKHEVKGLENIPNEPCIIFSKHQSTWETLALQLVFPAQTFIVKRELMWVPFFGWGLAMLKPVAIDRKAGRNAMEQVVKQGRERLEQGIWLVIFPEGHRYKPGTKTKYKKGAGVLAEKTGYPVIPVAHNAGEFWRKKQFVKTPGIVKMHIGQVISTKGKRAEDIVEEGRQWIESELHKINPDVHPGP